MTLEFFKDNQELMANCVLWYTGRNETNLGFPILPAGVTVTPNGTWSNDLSLGNSKSLKTFDGSTNYISLSDNDAWTFWDDDATVCGWIKFGTISVSFSLCSQVNNSTSRWNCYWSASTTQLRIFGYNTSVVFSYSGSTWTPTIGVWYHITMVRSGSTCLMYLNGISQTVTEITAWGTIGNVSGALNIGYNYIGSAEYSKGNWKDLMIFKGRALSAAEITTLMRMTSPVTGREFELLYPGQRGVE